MLADQPTENPLRAGLRTGQPPEPVTVVIFGATGDLTHRKLVPALYSLSRENRLPSQFNIVGYARRDWSHDFFREQMHDGVAKFSRYPVDEGTLWENFADSLFFVQGNFDDVDAYGELDSFLKQQADRLNMPDNRIYYLAAPPQYYDHIVTNLGTRNMAKDSDQGWRRIVIEKPFGHDLATALALNETVHAVFKEQQVYRIDHYLGKETVQNILILRFANAIFEPIWNRRYVDHIQISVAESVGVGSRAGYYDQAGVARDIIQNHALQILTLIAMEPPIAMEADPIRDEKVKVLRAIRAISIEDIAKYTVRAQYGPGNVDGENVPGYCEAPGVAENSETATYAAIKWYVDSWRWQGIPIYMRSGKRMPTRATEVSIQFKSPPHLLFNSIGDDTFRSNALTIRIQPDEGIALHFVSKVPGQGMVRRPVTMNFQYGTSFGATASPDAYERLLLDSMLGDATLFARHDEIEWAWRLVDPILTGWESEHAPPLETYEAGTWGPSGADDLLDRDGFRWRRI